MLVGWKRRERPLIIPDAFVIIGEHDNRPSSLPPLTAREQVLAIAPQPRRVPKINPVRQTLASLVLLCVSAVIRRQLCLLSKIKGKLGNGK